MNEKNTIRIQVRTSWGMYYIQFVSQEWLDWASKNPTGIDWILLDSSNPGSILNPGLNETTKTQTREETIMLTKEERKVINLEFLENDESHLWPINGKFNATERAIRRIAKAERDGLIIDDPLSYRQILDDEISEIVNNSQNW